MIKNIIIGKRSKLSQKLHTSVKNSILLNINEFESFNFQKNYEYNLIINSFYPVSILRLKGFVQFKGPNQVFLIQAVGPIFSEIELLENVDLAELKTSLVIIFKDMDISEIENSFARHVLNH